jgi:hypothetical protein
MAHGAGLVNAVSLGLIIAGATLVVALITVGLMILYRRRDRQTAVEQTVEALVRESSYVPNPRRC